MNKVEKIKAEIERLKKSLPWGSCASQLSMECNCKNEAYNEVLSYIDSLEEEPVSEDLEYASEKYACRFSSSKYGHDKVKDAFITGAQWQKEHLWKDAQGDDLPEIDREVIVLVKSLPEHEDSLLKVSIAHRPPEYWMGKNIGTGEITRYEPKRYGNGSWNQPNVVYWLDVELPKEEE